MPPVEFAESPDLPTRDHFDKLEAAGELLIVKPLPPGSYQLKLEYRDFFLYRANRLTGSHHYPPMDL